MSSELDPAKLKVVELRAELQARGLDVKGNKPVLVKRLKEALEAEEKKDDTVTDTSALEEGGASEEEAENEEKQEKDEDSGQPDPEPEKESSPEPVKVKKEPATPKKGTVSPRKENAAQKKEVTPSPKKDVSPRKAALKTEVTPKKEPVKVEPEEKEEEEEKEEVESEPAAVKAEESSEPLKEEKEGEEESIEENGTNGEAGDDDSEPKNRKSRWGSEAKSQEEEEEPMEQDADPNSGEPKPESEAVRGEKRKHGSPSPERQQRRRSRSPDNEDEPTIDPSNVQLSWYDSDLHLEIDKETFLSAKPLNDGAFGYIWSGARLTHGVKTGKACYEVKVVEQMKFVDMLEIVPLKDHRKDRNDNKKSNRNQHRNKKQEEKQAEKKEKTEEKKEEEGDAKMESNTDDDTPKEEEMKEEVEDKKEEVEEKKEDAEEKEEDEKKEEEVKMEVDEKKEVDEDKKKEEEEEDKDKPDEEEGGEDEAEEKPEESKPEEAHNIPTHIIRIGWSVGNSSLQLGEDEFSYGLESSGKFFVNKEVTEHDFKFGAGDVVTAYLEFTEDNIVMTFTVNGEKKLEHTISRADITDEEFVLFPHVITRNFSYQLNIGKLEEPLAPTLEGFEDFSFIDSLEDKVKGESGPTSRKECEIIMMCGLPASGKTHWVKEHVEKTPERKYHIIGISSVLDRMTVDAKPIEEKISRGRWNVVLDKLTKCLNRMCELAAMRRRNFILDQTNVFPAAQRRKMRSFWGFKRHAVIVVNEDEEQARRLKQQESQTGKDLPESTVLEMKAIMSIPRTGEWLEKVTFASLPEAEAKAQVQKYNQQGREAGFGTNRRDRYDYNNRWGHGTPRRDYRMNFRDNRLHHNNRYSDRGGYRQGRGGGGGGGDGWRSGGGGGGWMRNDRRDNRGPRDWRNSRGGMNDRHRGGGNRDHRQHGSGGGNYNRNRNMTPSGGNRNHGGGNWGNQQSGGWNNQNHQGGWGGNQGQNQNWGQGWNQAQGNWNQNQWKYGGGYNQGGYGQYPSWNYYGQYAQNWNTQQGQSGQMSSTTSGTTTSNTTTDTTQQQQYAQMTPQQQQAAWAQYAQQYAQSTNAAATQK